MVTRLDPMNIVRDLAALPHRGTTTAQERRAADILTGHLEGLGAIVERQAFRTPRAYVWMVWWLAGGIATGLLLIPASPWLAFALVVLCVGSALLYFDWRTSPVLLLPPRATSENVIGRPAQREGSERRPEAGRRKLVLMGHYDSAPVSLLYLPSMVKGFRRGLLINLGVMILSVGVALAAVVNVGQPAVTWLRSVFIFYFIVLGVVSSTDFFRHGYSNGAADNATGTAAAIATFERLQRDPIPGWDVEVVLTGAEEVGMRGAIAYFRAYQRTMDPRSTWVLNFDTLGAGDLKVITRTGSVNDIVYDNPMVDAALQVTSADARFSGVKSAEWHTGDFDSLWFARASIPSLTLTALDAEGQMPHLHRPSDTIENVDAAVVTSAVDFAEAFVRRLAGDGPAVTARAI